MTPSNIDRNIVEMRFDNTQFESNVKESLKTIAKLKQELEFGDVSKGFDELEKTGKHFKANFVVDMRDVGNSVDEVGNKFSALQVMGVTALANLTNQAVNYGKKIAKALTIEPVMAGKGKYESYLRSVQTMLFQDDTLSESAVAGAMDNVLEYVDQTSYGFAELTKLISQFTSYGIELEKAEKMAEGVGNWGGLSGKNVNELGVAFYNIPQMIAAGAVKQMDWKSINLTGMAIKQFKELVIDMAIESGRLIQTGEHAGRTVKGTDVNFQSFDQTLKECWFDADLLADVLVKMSDRTEGLGKKGFLASQRALGLADALNAIKDAASTGWLNSFTLIFGMVDGAARIFTDFADAVMTVISLDAEFRNSILGKWLNTGEIWDDRNDRDNFLIGRFDVNRDRMRDTASNLWYGFTEIKKAIENGLDISFTGVGRHFGEDEANHVSEQYALFLGNVTDKINAASLKFRSWLTGQDYTQGQYIIEGIGDVAYSFDEARYKEALSYYIKSVASEEAAQKLFKKHHYNPDLSYGPETTTEQLERTANEIERILHLDPKLEKKLQSKNQSFFERYFKPSRDEFTETINEAGDIAKQVEESGKDVQLFGYFWRDWTQVLADGKTPLESITDLTASLGNVLQIVGKAIHVVAAPVISFLDRIMRPGGIVSTILSDISTSLLWITDTVKNSGILDLLGGFFEKVGGFIGFLIEAGFFTIRDTLRNLFVGIPSAISEGLNKLKTFLFGEKGDWVEYEFGFTFNPDKKKTEGAIDKVIKWAKETWSKIKGPLGNISQVLGAFSASVGSSFGNLWTAIQETFGMDTSGVEGGFFERLSARLQPLRDYFSNLWPNLKQTFITELEKINPDLAKSLRELYHKIKKTVQETWNNITTTVTSILNGTFDWGEAGRNALATLETWKTWLGGKLTEFRNWLFEQFPFLRDAYDKLHAFLFGEDIVETTAPEKHLKGGKYLARSFTSITHKNGLIDNIREWFDIPEEEEERTPLQKFFAGISGGIQDGIDWIGQKLPFLEGVFNKLKTLIFGGWEPYTTATGVEAKTYRKGWSEYIREWASGAWDWFTVPEATGEGEEGEKKTGLQTFIGEVGEWIDKQFHGEDGESGIIGKLTNFKAKVEEFVRPVTDWFTVPDANKENKTGFQIFIDGVVSWFDALPGRIGTAVETVKKAFHDAKVWLFGEDVTMFSSEPTRHKNGFFDNLGELGQRAKALFGEGAENYSKWQTEDGSVFGFLRFVWDEVKEIGTLFKSNDGGTSWFESIKEFFGKIGELFHGKKAEEAKDAASDAKESAGEVGGIVTDLRETTQQISDSLSSSGFSIWDLFISRAKSEGVVNEAVQQSVDEANKEASENPEYKKYGVFGGFKAWWENLLDGANNLVVDLNNDKPRWLSILESLAGVLNTIATAVLKFTVSGAIRRLTGGFSLKSLFGDKSVTTNIVELGIGLALLVWSIKSLMDLTKDLSPKQMANLQQVFQNIFNAVLTPLIMFFAGTFLDDLVKADLAKSIEDGKDALKAMQNSGIGELLFGIAAMLASISLIFNSIDFNSDHVNKDIQKVSDLVTQVITQVFFVLLAKETLDMIPSPSKSQSVGDKFSGFGNTVFNLGIGLAALLWGINAIIDLYNRIKEDIGSGNVETMFTTIGAVIGGLLAGFVATKLFKDNKDPKDITKVGNQLGELLKAFTISTLTDAATKFIKAMNGQDPAMILTAMIALSFFLMAATFAIEQIASIKAPPVSSMITGLADVLVAEVFGVLITAVAGLAVWAIGNLDPSIVETIENGGNILFAVFSAIGLIISGLLYGLSKMFTGIEDDGEESLEMLKKIKDLGLTEDDIDALTPVVDLLWKLSDAKNKLPNIGGIVEIWRGKSEDFATLAGELKAFMDVVATSFPATKAQMENINYDDLTKILTIASQVANVAALTSIASKDFTSPGGVTEVLTSLMLGALDSVNSNEVQTKLAEVLNATDGTISDPLQTKLKVNIVFDMDEQNNAKWNELFSPNNAASRVALKFEQSNQIDYSNYLSSIESKLDILGADMANLKIYINSHALVGQIAPELSRRFAQQYAMVGHR